MRDSDLPVGGVFVSIIHTHSYIQAIKVYRLRIRYRHFQPNTWLFPCHSANKQNIRGSIAVVYPLLRLLLRLRLAVGCFCFVLARFFFEFNNLHIRSAVAQVDTGAACCIRCCTLRSGRAFHQVSRQHLRHNPHTLDWP